MTHNAKFIMETAMYVGFVRKTTWELDNRGMAHRIILRSKERLKIRLSASEMDE